METPLRAVCNRHDEIDARVAAVNGVFDVQHALSREACDADDGHLLSPFLARDVIPPPWLSRHVDCQLLRIVGASFQRAQHGHVRRLPTWTIELRLYRPQSSSVHQNGHPRRGCAALSECAVRGKGIARHRAKLKGLQTQWSCLSCHCSAMLCFGMFNTALRCFANQNRRCNTMLIKCYSDVQHLIVFAVGAVLFKH